MNSSQLAAYLREPSAHPVEDWPADLVPAAARHGVAPLLYAAYRDARRRSPAADALARIAREHALLETVQRAETARVVAACRNAGVRVLLFKGTGLAYTVYAQPWHRPRADTDLLVRGGDANATAALLEALGYARVPRPTGEFVTQQFTYAGSRDGVVALFDVHRKIFDPHAFADVLGFDELAVSAVTIPDLDDVSTVCDAHALVIACVHRVAHHYDEDSLIRMCDIDRLARRLSAADWELVVEVCVRGRIRAVVRRGLVLSRELFGTPVPESVSAALVHRDHEPSERYLRPGLRRIDILLSDLGALPNWPSRVGLIREHLFPPASYASAAAAGAGRNPLPIKYLSRIVRGAAAWFEPLLR